jgi:hypothetical protein
MTGDHLFKKGQSGNPAGRAKSTAIKAFKKKLADLDYDSVKTVVDLALHGKPDKVRVEAAGLILAREYAALKSVEISAQEGAQFSLNIIRSSKKD